MKNIILIILALTILSNCSTMRCTDDGCPEFCKDEYNECKVEKKVNPMFSIVRTIFTNQLQ